MSSDATTFWLVLAVVISSIGCAGAPAVEAPTSQRSERRDPPGSAASESAGTSERALDIDQSANSVFLSELPVDATERALWLVSSATTDQAFAHGLRVRVQVMSGYRRFGELTRRGSSRVVDGVVQLDDLSLLESSEKPSATHKSSSFVIDYDQPAVVAIQRELDSGEREPDPRRIQAFVSHYIEDKTYARAFDIASRVATTRSGDCTEHAVLAAALLRSAGYAARVVLGVVLVGVSRDQETRMLAAGHAWVELYQDDQWQVIDAALFVSGPSDSNVVGVPGLPRGVTLRLAYLPVNIMKEEGPGFARALMDEEGIDGVMRIQVDARK